MHLILTSIKPLPHLIKEAPLVTAVRYFELGTTWKHRLLLQHERTAIDDDEAQVGILLFLRIHR